MLFEAVLVDDRTSTGHPKQPVLLSVATSTSQLSDQYWSIFPFYNSALLLRRKSLRPLSGSQLFLIQYYISFLQAQEERKVHLWIESTPIYGFIYTR